MVGGHLGFRDYVCDWNAMLGKMGEFSHYAKLKSKVYLKGE